MLIAAHMVATARPGRPAGLPAATAPCGRCLPSPPCLPGYAPMASPRWRTRARGAMALSCGPAQWGDLEAGLPPPAPQTVWDTSFDLSGPHPATRPGTAVLYRDRNGWCPYSERVWLGLMVKGCPFDEVLVDNQGSKPRFYYSMGGSGTPMIRWPGDTELTGESLDILLEMDERFPGGGGSLLPHDAGLREEAVELARSMGSMLPARCRPSSRAAFLYRGGSPVPRADFDDSLREIDGALRRHGGPFFMGPEPCIADVAFAPFLERFAVQLPLLHQGLRPRDSAAYPALAAWFAALERQIPGYAARVQGDAMSWAAVLSVAGYGNAGSVEAYRPPEEEGAPLGLTPEGHEIWVAYRDTRGGGAAADTPGAEAARKLVTNRTAIIADIQRNLRAAPSEGEIDRALRVAAAALLSGDVTSVTAGRGAGREAERAVGAFMLQRLCAPRDMGRLPADCFRHVMRLLAE